MGFFVINIDDEESVDSSSVSSVNYFSASDFIDALNNDETLMASILNPNLQILISLDEHLPWDSFQGKDIYEFLGLFTKSLPVEVRSRVFPLGITSSSLGQRYMPKDNRFDKSFFAKLNDPEKYFDPNKLRSAADIFTDSGYYDYEKNEEVKYSDKAFKLLNNLEKNKELVKIN